MSGLGGADGAALWARVSRGFLLHAVATGGSVVVCLLYQLGSTVLPLVLLSFLGAVACLALSVRGSLWIAHFPGDRALRAWAWALTGWSCSTFLVELLVSLLPVELGWLQSSRYVEPLLGLIIVCRVGQRLDEGRILAQGKAGLLAWLASALAVAMAPAPWGLLAMQAVQMWRAWLCLQAHRMLMERLVGGELD